jgi:hypothetical protein
MDSNEVKKLRGISMEPKQITNRSERRSSYLGGPDDVDGLRIAMAAEI